MERGAANQPGAVVAWPRGHRQGPASHGRSPQGEPHEGQGGRKAMRRLWIRSLALSLGLVAPTAVQAQEALWRAPQAHPSGPAAPPVALGKPIAIATSKPA